jgi:hypothetical protein
MGKCCLALAVAIATFASAGSAQQAAPYKVLKAARVGGEGGWDYIYADAACIFREVRRAQSPPQIQRQR